MSKLKTVAHQWVALQDESLHVAPEEIALIQSALDELKLRYKRGAEMSIETLKRAAELLRESVQYRPEQYDPYFADHEKETNTIAAELEAMAEHLTPRPIPGWEMADQKPVAWIDPNNLKEVLARETGALRYLTRTPEPGDVALYISPQPKPPEGWQLVPIEPTPEMLDAVAWPNAAKTDYAHMLAAAPKPEMKE